MKGFNAMFIEMFNAWYFFWFFMQICATTGLYFALRKANRKTQHAVLYGLLIIGLLAHFLKVYIPPYSVDEARMLRDSWFINICGANIALFPFLYFSKNKYIKDYMFYLGVLTGLIVLFYPQEPIAKGDQAAQMAEFWDIVRFYFHHWMIMAVPLLMVLLGHHKLSYKRVWAVPIGLLLLMLFIILNQVFQAELGFFELWNKDDFLAIHFKNTSYIWGPGENDAIGNFLALFCPDFFKTVPVGAYAGQPKYWPWFWMIFPAFILVTPLAFGLSMIFDHKQFGQDMKKLFSKFKKDKVSA